MREVLSKVEQKKKRRMEHKNLGLCRDCSSLIVDGSVFCIKHHASTTAYRAKRLAEGLCQICGTPRDSLKSNRCAKCRAKNNARQKKYTRLIRIEVLNHYGSRCACCGEEQFEFLTIDHIENDGAAHRKEIGTNQICGWLKRNNYPEGFQVLCWNCNTAKYFHGGCPHTRNTKV